MVLSEVRKINPQSLLCAYYNFENIYIIWDWVCVDQEICEGPWEGKLSLREKAQNVNRTVDMEEKEGRIKGGGA